VFQILPGHNAKGALTALQDAARELGNVQGQGLSGIDALNAYRSWGNLQAQALAGHVTGQTLDSLITTPRYWTLQSIDPIAYGPALQSFVSLAITETKRDLEAAASRLDAQISEWSNWGGVAGQLNAVVLDTNVLLRHSRDLQQIDWCALSKVWPDSAIALVIPLVVVEELDKKKSSNETMEIASGTEKTRNLARRALRELESFFPEGRRTHVFGQREHPDHRLGSLRAMLLIDDLDRVRQSRNDAEVIEIALDLQPFAAKVTIATYDNSMIFRAQAVELSAAKPFDDLQETAAAGKSQSRITGSAEP